MLAMVKRSRPGAYYGLGFSLVLINPGENPHPGDPANWRSSTTAGGNPGSGDSETFSGNPNDDLDGDGIEALLEHALGSSDLSAIAPKRTPNPPIQPPAPRGS